MSWEARASCRHYELGLWFKPTEVTDDRPNDDYYRFARNVCAGCPVRRECLEAAMDEEERLTKSNRFGMRGGLTPPQRWELADRRGRAHRAFVLVRTHYDDDEAAS